MNPVGKTRDTPIQSLRSTMIQIRKNPDNPPWSPRKAQSIDGFGNCNGELEVSFLHPGFD
jgi:hypothetical protein